MEGLRYFARCRTKAEGLERMRELARRHHPDGGGDVATMQEVNREWAEWQTLERHGHFADPPKARQATPKPRTAAPKPRPSAPPKARQAAPPKARQADPPKPRTTTLTRMQRPAPAAQAEPTDARAARASTAASAAVPLREYLQDIAGVVRDVDRAIQDAASVFAALADMIGSNDTDD